MALFFLLLGSPVALAQIDLMGALKQTAEMHNEENAQGQESNGEESSASSEGQNAWQEEWEKMMNENGDLLNSLDTKYLKCLAMMEMYVHGYLKLVNEHKMGDLSMSACDAYGMQTLALASSTMIMYCPEGMKDGELNDNQRAQLVVEYGKTIYKKEPLWRIHRYLDGQYGHWITSTGGEITGDTLDYHNYIAYLIAFFRPSFIIPQTLKIAEEMEALGCSG